jgi:hypothetical protein
MSSSSSQFSYRYAILMETNGEESESWYNFIRYEGNEDALNHLQKQLEKVDFYVLDDMSTFDLELEHLVDESTARQMCIVDLNSYMFHRKFDGKLQKIDFGFSRKDDNEDRIEKVHEKIGFGDIDNFVDGEEEFKDDNESQTSNHSVESYNSQGSYDNSDDESRSPSPVKNVKKEKKEKKEKPRTK